MEKTVGENRIAVLDHGYVRLIDHMGSDMSIIRAARVSYNAAWRAGEDDEGDKKLMRYLWKNKHTTPFEAVTFTFEVKAPIFIFRQWHRHRTWSYNELSARYRELDKEFYVPVLGNIGSQSKDNKQGRSLLSLPESRATELSLYTAQCERAFELYHRLIESNWPKELARNVLPVSTYSTMFATVNLLNLLKFLTLRADSHAQYEIRVYADAMIHLISPIIPVALAAWNEYR